MKKNFILFVACFIFISVCSSAQTPAAGNKPSKSNTKTRLPHGKAVVGIFEGRPPCLAIAKQLKIQLTSDCPKLKWRLTLFRDSITHQPTTYKLEGSLFPTPDFPVENKWIIVEGMPGDPAAVVYQLLSDRPGVFLCFMKGDDNVLFILDENKNFRVGNEHFSYTLNRVSQ